MNSLTYKMLWLSAILMLAPWRANVAQADGDSNPLLIEKALDKPAVISLKQITLEDVFLRLSQKMGIEIDLEEAGPALSQLPYGKLTQIESAHIEGLTWRKALAELLKPFSLTFQPGADRIYILGTNDLMRQPERLSISELEAIVLLQNSLLDNKSDNLLQQIRTRTNIQFDLFVHGKKLDRIDREDGRRILNQGPLTAADALDQYSQRIYRRGQASTWYIQSQVEEGRATRLAIHVVGMGQLIELKLDQRIDIAFKSLPIQTILHNLAQRAALDIRFEPGCIGLVDANLRENCSLVMYSGTIKSALEALSGMTGLEYSYSPQGLLIRAGENLIAMAGSPRSAASNGTANPLMCIITMEVPNADYESRILIRENDFKKEGLLEKFQQVQQQNIQKFMQNLRDFPIEQK
jgi:hypothetical protein